MDKKITVRFFKVSKNHKSAPALEAALKNALQSGATASKRQRNVYGNIIRLERLVQNGTFWDGEVVRKQAENIPPEAHDEGLTALALKEGGGLGHPIAFRYSPSLSVLAMQFDNRAVSVNKLMAYLQAIDPAHGYSAFPLVREDAWERYGRGTPSKFTIEIAAPSELPSVEGEIGSVIESAKRLAEISSAPVISLEAKMGHSKGSLKQKSVDKLIQFFTKGKGSTHDIRKLNVTNRHDDGPSEEIDFLKEFLACTSHLELSGNDPDVNYDTRKIYLTACFNDNFAYIKTTYGGKDAGPN